MVSYPMAYWGSLLRGGSAHAVWVGLVDDGQLHHQSCLPLGDVSVSVLANGETMIDAPANTDSRFFQLTMRQANPLDVKIGMSERRIREWYQHWGGNVYVAFSGGKDSTVLLDLVRNIYPEVPAVFSDTGLEFPEIRDFVKTVENVTWLKPKMHFRDVLDKYGYPVISKRIAQAIHEVRTTKSEYLRKLRLTGERRDGTFSSISKISNKWQFLIDTPFLISDKCCKIMKKDPSRDYAKETGREPYVGTMASEGFARRTSYLRHGCNAFDLKSPRSAPLSFWLEEDIWAYLREKDLPYSSIYDKGYDRTGCMFCMFGVQCESEPNRFQRMAQIHPKIHNYCMNKLGLKPVLEAIGVPWK